MVSWFLCFFVSKIYPMSISCFMKDIDPISKIFKDHLLNGSSGFFGAHLFANSPFVNFKKIIFINNIFVDSETCSSFC